MEDANPSLQRLQAQRGQQAGHLSSLECFAALHMLPFPSPHSPHTCCPVGLGPSQSPRKLEPPRAGLRAVAARGLGEAPPPLWSTHGQQVDAERLSPHMRSWQCGWLCFLTWKGEVAIHKEEVSLPASAWTALPYRTSVGFPGVRQMLR